VARCTPPGDTYKTVGLETLAPSDGKVPPGGLGLCRLPVLGVAPGENLTIYDLCCVVFKQ